MTVLLYNQQVERLLLKENHRFPYSKELTISYYIVGRECDLKMTWNRIWSIIQNISRRPAQMITCRNVRFAYTSIGPADLRVIEFQMMLQRVYPAVCRVNKHGGLA